MISNNFGRWKNNSAKDRKALETYVSLRGYKHGQVGGGYDQTSQNGNSGMTLEEIAKQLGTSKTNLTRALRIGRNLTDTMKELLDAGEITKTFASDIKQPIQIQTSKKEKALYAIIILPMHNLTPLAPDNAIQGLFICLENVIYRHA